MATTWKRQPSTLLGMRSAVAHGFRLSVAGLVRGSHKRQGRSTVGGYRRINAMPKAGRPAQSPRMALVSRSQDKKEVSASGETCETVGPDSWAFAGSHRTVSRTGSRESFPPYIKQPILVARVHENSGACWAGRCEPPSGEKTRNKTQPRPKESSQFSQRLRVAVGGSCGRGCGVVPAETLSHGRSSLSDHSRALPPSISPTPGHRCESRNASHLVEANRLGCEVAHV